MALCGNNRRKKCDPDRWCTLYRTIRAALDALLDFGRPEKVALCALIDRRFSKQLPSHPDYTGKSIDAIVSQKVKVFWKSKDGKDEVCIIND